MVAEKVCIAFLTPCQVATLHDVFDPPWRATDEAALGSVPVHPTCQVRKTLHFRILTQTPVACLVLFLGRIVPKPVRLYHAALGHFAGHVTFCPTRDKDVSRRETASRLIAQTPTTIYQRPQVQLSPAIWCQRAFRSFRSILCQRRASSGQVPKI